MITLTLIQTNQLQSTEGASLRPICLPACVRAWVRAHDYKGGAIETRPVYGDLGFGGQDFGGQGSANQGFGNQDSNKPSDHAPEVTP